MFLGLLGSLNSFGLLGRHLVSGDIAPKLGTTRTAA